MSKNSNNSELTDYYQLRKGNIKKTDTKNDIEKEKQIVKNLPVLENKPEETRCSDSEKFDDNILDIIFDNTDTSRSNEENSIDLTISKFTNKTIGYNNQNFHCSKMGTQTLNISQALKIIDSFNGSSSNLHKFLACCD